MLGFGSQKAASLLIGEAVKLAVQELNSSRAIVPVQEQLKILLEEIEHLQRWVDDFDYENSDAPRRELEMKRFRRTLTDTLNRAYERRIESLK